jgi:hypothetical protein
MAQTRLKSGNLHMIGGDNGSDGNVLKSKGDGTMEWGTATTPPTFSSVDYPGNDTALDPAGGQSLVINGGGFVAGISCSIGGTTVTSITVNSATQITVVTPAKSAGTYSMVLTNTDGGNATASGAISYNGIPAFTHNAGSLGTFKQGDSVSVSVVATEPDGGAITHTVTTGALPSGLSLNATTGAITGTASDVTATTTTSFSITATDNENQSTVRAYSITVNPVLPSDDFEVLSYTGNGGTQNITGLSFKPDFVWLKPTNVDGEHHLIHPNVGTGEYFRPSYPSQGRLNRSDIITALNNNGFSLGSESATNTNNNSYVAYCWKINGGTSVSNTDGTNTVTTEVNAAKGISAITYSGNGSTQTVGHGLGKVPEMFFMMDRYNGGGWRVWHKDLDGPNKYLETGSGGQSTSSTIWNNTLPTSTVFSLGNTVPPNGSGRAHVCWAFTSIDKHSRFSFYTGNGANFGPIIDLGFEPALLMIRRIDSGDNWMMFDNQRQTSNPRNQYLQFGGSQAQSQGNIGTGVDFLSNGFMPTSTDGSLNANNGKYIYAAWAQDPDVVAPTLADSFSTKLYTGNGGTQSVTGTGFKPDLVWIKQRSGTQDQMWYDNNRGAGHYLSSNNANAQGYANTTLTSFDADGFSVGSSNSENQSGQTFVAWSWKGNDNEPTMTEATEDAPAVAVYKFEDNANDVSTNSNGTASNMSYATGKFNKAGVFNGSSSYIDTNYTMPAGSKYSFSLWFNTTYTGTYSTLYSDHPSNGAGVGARVMAAIYQGNKFQINIANGSSQWSDNTAVDATPYLDGNWHHHVVTVDGNTVKLYIDGFLLNTYTSSVTAGTAGAQSISIGRLGDYNGEYFPGKLDQFRIYNKTLDQTSVTKLYNETASQNSTLNIGTKGIISSQAIVNANNNAGFSIVKYKGNGNADKIPHGLSAAPEMIITKRLTGTSPWYTYNAYLNGGTNPAHYFVNLNTDAAEASNGSSGGSLFNSTPPTSTIFNIGTSLSGSGDDYIAYCFHSVSGYSKFGSYTGTGSSGNAQSIGFQPDFVMVKSTAQYNWNIYDSKRPSGSITGRYMLIANANDTEYTTSVVHIDLTSNGFSFPNGYDGSNKSSQKYIYMAFKIN